MSLMPTPIRSAKGVGGFTLLEVLVALAVLAIALTSIYRLQTQTMLMNGSARFYSLAPKLAQARLAEVERMPFDQITDGSGDYGDDHPGYTWELLIEDLPTDLINTPKYHLVRLSVTVSENDENEYRLDTYRFLYAE